MLEPVHEETLENGLKVLSLEQDFSPTVSLALFYRVGSRNERSGTTGISHAFEHLMFKGTGRFPSGEFDRIMLENGIGYNAYTSHDFTCYHAEMASDRLGLVMELEADRMQGLLLDEDGFRTEMAVIREERKETVEDTPFGLLSEMVQASAWLIHPYRNPVIGWMSDLVNLTLEDVSAWYREFYRPNNAVLVIAGDVAATAAVDLARRHFGPVPAGPSLVTRPAIEPPQAGERAVTLHRKVELPGILLAFRAPAGSAREARVLNVIEFLLLHGRSSRLYRKLIYRRQLATGLAGGFSLRIDPSLFVIRAAARPGVALEDLRAAVLEELEDLALRPVPEPEITKAKNAIEADFIFSRESSAGLAQDLGQDECLSTWRSILSWLPDHLSVTAEEITRVAREVFSERNRTTGILLPEPAGALDPGTANEDGPPEEDGAP